MCLEWELSPPPQVHVIRGVRWRFMAHVSAVHGAVFSDRILALFIFNNLWPLRHANMPDYCCEFKMWFHHRKVGTCTRGSSTGCWEEYLDLRGAKIQESGEKYTVRSFGTYVLYRTLLGSLCQGGWMAGERARWHIMCVCVYIYIYIYIVLIGNHEGKRLFGEL
jgi:hypothetical protein